jgi:hypothetical protein
VPCSKNDPEQEVSCGNSCGIALPSCGHPCARTCHGGPCNLPGAPATCKARCDRPLTCGIVGHLCQEECRVTPCPPCNNNVELRCDCGIQIISFSCKDFLDWKERHPDRETAPCNDQCSSKKALIGLKQVVQSTLSQLADDDDDDGTDDDEDLLITKKNERIRDLLIAKKNQVDLLIAKKDLIVDAATADYVVKFLFSFSQDESLRSLLRTKEVQNLIINNIAPHVTAIDEFGYLICNIVLQHVDLSSICENPQQIVVAAPNKHAAELFSNVESFSAILKCFHRSKTSNDANNIACSIFCILFFNPSSNKLLNSLPVAEAFSFILPAKNKEDVKWISLALLHILTKHILTEKSRTTKLLRSSQNQQHSWRSSRKWIVFFRIMIQKKSFSAK